MKVSPEMKKLLLERGTVGPAPQLPGQPPEAKKKPKYHNVKTEVDGIIFDSRREARRWMVLKAELAAGMISMLRRQVSFRLVVRGVLIARYRADFTFVQDGKLVVMDVKGAITPVYKLKRRLMKACLGIEITEV